MSSITQILTVILSLFSIMLKMAKNLNEVWPHKIYAFKCTSVKVTLTSLDES